MERLGEGLKKLALAGIGQQRMQWRNLQIFWILLQKKVRRQLSRERCSTKELKHNVKSTIKDYKASNGKMHTVHEAEVVEAEVVEDDDIPGSATEVEDVDDHEETETEEAETDSKMETVEETETEEE